MRFSNSLVHLSSPPEIIEQIHIINGKVDIAYIQNIEIVNHFYFAARVRSTTGGCVFKGVCLFGGGARVTP